MQYETSIADMLQKQSLRLDESQEKEVLQLKEKLDYELEILMAYQSKNRAQAQAQRDRERKELEDRVNVRRALLESKVSVLVVAKQGNEMIYNNSHLCSFQMDAELQQFNQERAERIRECHDRHEKEFHHFNEESARMGFRWVD